MIKLELKHIAPYLPYSLKYVNYSALRMGLSKPLIGDINNMNIMGFIDGETVSKPILRPLSDLTKHECFNRLSDNLQLSSKIFGLPNYLDLKVCNYNILLENHFDIFGLIQHGLAIDINTLKNE